MASHQKPKSTSYRPQDVRLIILGTYNARQTDPTLPSAGHMSSPQTFEAGPTRQSADTTSRAVSSGHSTTIESMARTGTLRHRVPTPPPAISTGDARQLIEDYIKGSTWYQTHMMEPSVGDVGVPACALLLVGELGVPVSALQLAKRGHSVWACFVKGVRREGRLIFKCTTCTHETDRLHRAVNHQRAKWGHKPFACTDRGW